MSRVSRVLSIPSVPRKGATLADAIGSVAALADATGSVAALAEAMLF